jgi:hypothetical protein
MEKPRCYICNRETTFDSKNDSFAWINSLQRYEPFCDVCLWSRKCMGVAHTDLWVHQEKYEHLKNRRSGHCDYCHTFFTIDNQSCQECYTKKKLDSHGHGGTKSNVR